MCSSSLITVSWLVHVAGFLYIYIISLSLPLPPPHTNTPQPPPTLPSPRSHTNISIFLLPVVRQVLSWSCFFFFFFCFFFLCVCRSCVAFVFSLFVPHLSLSPFVGVFEKLCFVTVAFPVYIELSLLIFFWKKMSKSERLCPQCIFPVEGTLIYCACITRLVRSFRLVWPK